MKGKFPLESQSMYPHYSLPIHRTPGYLLSVLLVRPRSFHADAWICIERLSPPLRLLGEENIPQSGPVLITFNHYYRHGFRAWWLALAIAAVVPQEIHFGMTNELTYPGKWYAPLGRVLSRWLLNRLAKMYGFTGMPPMPPREKDVKARAEAVRAMLTYAREHQDAILALAPEGEDNTPNGVLAWPAPGAGRFIGLLASAGYPILPVGAYEENGEFCLCFGKMVELKTPTGKSPEERDRMNALQVMQSIARLLPEGLRGEFEW